MSQVGQYTDKVDRWRGGSHIQRWAAAGLLELESRLPKMKRFRYLKLLRMKLQEEVAKRQKKTRLRKPYKRRSRGGYTYRYPGKLMAEIYGGLNQFQLKFALTREG